MKNLGTVLITGALLAACAPDSSISEAKVKLAEANQKIASLEKELAELKSAAAAPGTDKDRPARLDGTLVPPPEPKPEPEPAGQQWRYDVSEDPMSGAKRHVASVRSSNTVSFSFPYSGVQRGTLTLRAQGKGKDVLFYIEQGQILCPSYQGCSAQVRFDEEKPVRFSANGPADHSSETIFLSDEGRFISKLKKSKRVRLAVDIYQNGAPAFEFDVSGFDQDKFQPKQ